MVNISDISVTKAGGSWPRARPHLLRRWRLLHATRLVGVIDAGIVASFGALLAYLVVGGFDLGILSVRRFSKPFLVCLMLASMRAALPVDSWLAEALRRTSARASRSLESLAARTPWARAVFSAAFAVAVVHTVSAFTRFFANLIFPAARPRAWTMPFAAEELAEAFAAWDSGWYFQIAKDGYSFDPSRQSSIAFFPAYPVLVGLTARVFGGSERTIWAAGIALSHVCLLAGLAVLFRFTEHTLGSRDVARRTVLYVAVFPFAYFFTQVYPSSLFLLLSVAAVFAARMSRWTWAGLFGGLASLSRPNGILIALPLGLMALSPWPGPRELARRTLALALVPAGLGAFCLYSWRLTGDPLAWLHAQEHWGYTLGNAPWVELMRLLDGLRVHGVYGYFFSDPLAPYYFLHGVTALGFVAVVPSVVRRLGVALGAYVAVSLYVPLTGNALEGIGRYSACLFPVFMLLGRIESRRAQEAILIGSALVLSLLGGLFVNLHPIY